MISVKICIFQTPRLHLPPPKLFERSGLMSLAPGPLTLHWTTWLRAPSTSQSYSYYSTRLRRVRGPWRWRVTSSSWSSCRSSFSSCSVASLFLKLDLWGTFRRSMYTVIFQLLQIQEHRQHSHQEHVGRLHRRTVVLGHRLGPRIRRRRKLVLWRISVLQLPASPSSLPQVVLSG